MEFLEDLTKLYQRKEGACRHSACGMELGIGLGEDIVVPLCKKVTNGAGIIVIPQFFAQKLSHNEFYLMVQYFTTVLKRTEINESPSLSTIKYLEVRATLLMREIPGIKVFLEKVFCVRKECIEKYAWRSERRKLLKELSSIWESVNVILQII